MSVNEYRIVLFVNGADSGASFCAAPPGARPRMGPVVTVAEHRAKYDSRAWKSPSCKAMQHMIASMSCHSIINLSASSVSVQSPV